MRSVSEMLILAHKLCSSCWIEAKDAQTVTYPGAPLNKLVLLCYYSPAVVKAEKLSSVCSAFDQQKLSRQ